MVNPPVRSPSAESAASAGSRPESDSAQSASALPEIEAIELSPEESVQAWAEARRAARALEDTGFYSPQIARHQLNHSFGEIAMRVLVVEDDDMTARMLELLLTQHDFHVTRVADGETALAELKKRPAPDLVLLDGMLPDKDGFDILKEVRHDTALCELPVIMVTSRISDEYVMRGLKEGADGYIFKPFKWESLHDCIKSVCGTGA